MTEDLEHQPRQAIDGFPIDRVQRALLVWGIALEVVVLKECHCCQDVVGRAKGVYNSGEGNMIVSNQANGSNIMLSRGGEGHVWRRQAEPSSWETWEIRTLNAIVL